MKRFLVMLVAMLLVMPATMEAQNKQLQRALQREAKAKLKQYKKEGWKVFGTSRSMDVALMKHYEQLEKLGEEGMEIMGTATRYKSDNIGHQMAVNNACNDYARKAGSHVKGRVVSDMAANADDSSMEFDKFYAAYESLVEKEIQGEMKETFAIYKELGKGEKMMQVYFVVDLNAASKARIRAYENALKESQLQQKYAESVSRFIQEGFKLED